ncbi:MAG: TetR/AcrR family transcriptional regulator [Gammaproteobacteria bacterium]|nr:TetR/AcrR family transcriptional regulator [Gammaproteobacteria bacterium]
MSTRRDKLIETAKDLFYKNGYRATGIDQILAEAGVSKPTMYKYFRSKDELIIASLKLWDAELRQSMEKKLEESGGKPLDKLLKVFDLMKDWMESPKFNGCMAISASIEYPEKESPIHAEAASQKNRLASYFEKLLSEAQIPGAHEVSEQIILIVEGAVVNAHLNKNSRAAINAKQLVETLLASRTSFVAAATA